MIPYEKTFIDAENNDFKKNIYLFILEREGVWQGGAKEERERVPSRLSSKLRSCWGP